MNFEKERRKMVLTQLIPRGINNPLVLKAFEKVPREEFIPLNCRADAYQDYPLPIGNGQTISQPFMVALMTQALELKKEDCVLEIGTGSGYQTAILAEIARKVFTVERFPDLSEGAQVILNKLGYENIFFKTGDGSRGWTENAPYHGVIVTAAAPSLPLPLIEQLIEEGRMIIPVGEMFGQSLIRARKIKGKLEKENICGCVFVPLIGEFGWYFKDDRNNL
ncbi:MAG: protein-L-isoaspartate(D-aspartate) O-methyltransferase [Candidatus Omnitrophota bacterium]